MDTALLWTNQFNPLSSRDRIHEDFDPRASRWSSALPHFIVSFYTQRLELHSVALLQRRRHFESIGGNPFDNPFDISFLLVILKIQKIMFQNFLPNVTHKICSRSLIRLELVMPPPTGLRVSVSISSLKSSLEEIQGRTLQSVVNLHGRGFVVFIWRPFLKYRAGYRNVPCISSFYTRFFEVVTRGAAMRR